MKGRGFPLQPSSREEKNGHIPIYRPANLRLKKRGIDFFFGFSREPVFFVPFTYLAFISSKSNCGTTHSSRDHLRLAAGTMEGIAGSHKGPLDPIAADRTDTDCARHAATTLPTPPASVLVHRMYHLPACLDQTTLISSLSVYVSSPGEPGHASLARVPPLASGLTKNKRLPRRKRISTGGSRDATSPMNPAR